MTIRTSCRRPQTWFPKFNFGPHFTCPQSPLTSCSAFPVPAVQGRRQENAMTPQERQLVDDLFDRLAQVESAQRDPQAGAAIAQGLQKAPNAVYALVQTVLLQDEALKRANSRIQELEAASQAPQQQGQSGGF